MAAFRNGIKTVIIPADNGKDLEEIDQTVRKALRFILVERADQVLDQALVRNVIPAVESGGGSKPARKEQETVLVPTVQDQSAARLRL